MSILYTYDYFYIVLYKNETIPSGELSLVYCDSCKLLQLENSFDKKKLYGDNYGYMSSLNCSMTSHLSRKANLLKKYNLINGDLIIDIGSNDGTFLSFFPKKFNLHFNQFNVGDE